MMNLSPFDIALLEQQQMQQQQNRQLKQPFIVNSNRYNVPETSALPETESMNVSKSYNQRSNLQSTMTYLCKLLPTRYCHKTINEGSNEWSTYYYNFWTYEDDAENAYNKMIETIEFHHESDSEHLSTTTSGTNELFHTNNDYKNDFALNWYTNNIVIRDQERRRRLYMRIVVMMFVGGTVVIIFLLLSSYFFS
jgi:hypothetical protein